MSRRFRAGLTSLLAVSLISSCSSPLPRTRADFGVPPSKRLKAALVVTAQTRDSLKRSYSDLYLGRHDPTKIFDDFALVMDEGFGNIVAVENAEDAKTAGVDLVATLDLDVQHKLASGVVEGVILVCAVTLLIPCLVSKRFSPGIVVNGSVTLTGLDGRHLERVALHSEHFGWRHSFLEMSDVASEELRGQFLKGLQGSQALASLAKAGQQKAIVDIKPIERMPAARLDIGSLVDTPSYKIPENPNNFALVIGIGRYSSLPTVKYAERDADSMRNHLLALGVPGRNLVLLPGGPASRAAIEKNIEAWLPLNVNEESRVYIYFSGHGTSDPESGQSYLMPWDGDPHFLKNTGYPLKRLYERLGALRAKEVIVLIDSSFAGTGVRSVMAQGSRPLAAKFKGAVPAGRLAVFIASGGDEAAADDDQEQHGLFTYHLLKMLNERRGKVSVRELQEAFSPRVMDAAQTQGRQQTPALMLGEASGLGEARFDK